MTRAEKQLALTLDEEEDEARKEISQTWIVGAVLTVIGLVIILVAWVRVPTGKIKDLLLDVGVAVTTTSILGAIFFSIQRKEFINAVHRCHARLVNAYVG